MPKTAKVSMVTPVVRFKLKSQGLLMPKMPKKMPNRETNRASFKINTMVRFSFLIVRKTIHLVSKRMPARKFFPKRARVLCGYHSISWKKSKAQAAGKGQLEIRNEE